MTYPFEYPLHKQNFAERQVFDVYRILSFDSKKITDCLQQLLVEKITKNKIMGKTGVNEVKQVVFRYVGDQVI